MQTYHFMLKVSEETILGAHGGLGRSIHDNEWSASVEYDIRAVTVGIYLDEKKI